MEKRNYRLIEAEVVSLISKVVKEFGFELVIKPSHVGRLLFCPIFHGLSF